MVAAPHPRCCCSSPSSSALSRSDQLTRFSHLLSMAPVSPSPSFSSTFRHPCSPLPRRSFSHHSRTSFIRNVSGLSKHHAHGATAISDPEAALKGKLFERAESSAQVSTPLVSDSSLTSPSQTAQEEQITKEEEAESLSDDDEDFEGNLRMNRVCDRLIEVFLIEKTKTEDWRKLLAFSKEWRKIRPHFFERCKSRAEQETDPQRKGDLSKLSRKMKEVDDDMERHNELIAYVKEHWSELDTVVTRRRKDFTNDFFQHLELLYQANENESDKQADLAAVLQKCMAAVETHDRAAEDDVAISIAQKKFDDILNSPSLGVACNKIDELAKRNELDSTMMLLITKAWAASKESTMMKDEVKDIMHHLYMVARGNMQRLVPKEVRIMRHILSFEDPKERFAALTEAFSPGEELEGKEIDLLYTTPGKLYNWINIVLDAYYQEKKSTLMESVRQLMNPTLISRLQVLKKTMEDQFL